MAGIIDQILLNISVAVSGAAGVNNLTGNIGGLNASLLNLSAGLNVVQQVTSGVSQMVGQLTVWADAANKAATNTKVFGLTVAKFGIDIDQANGAAQRLADQFGVSVTDIQDSMTTLIRVGFTNMGQLEAVMRGAGASAIAAGRDAKAGFSNIADAAATGMSAQLNSIGIAQNLSTYNDKLAKSLGKTTDALTSAEKAQALYNLVTAATGTEVEALGSIQNGYVKSQQAVTLSQQQFSIQLGQITMPLVQRFNELSAESTTYFTGLLKAYAEGGDVLGQLSSKYPLLGSAVKAVSDIFVWAKENAGALVGGLTGALLPGVISVAGGITAALLPALAAGAAALWALLAPVAPFIAAGAAIGFVLQKMGVGFDDVKRIAGQIGDAIGKAAAQIPAAWQRAQALLAPLLGTLQTAFGNAFRSVETVINQVLIPLWNSLAPKLKGPIEAAQTVVSGFGTFLKGVFEFVVNGVSGLIDGASDLIDNVFIPIWQRIGPAVEAALTIVLGLIKGAFTLLGGVFKSLGELLSGDWKGAWETIKGTVSSAWSSIADAIGNAWPVIKNQVDNLAARISMAFQSGLAGLKSILLNALASMLEWAAEKMPSILQSAALKAAGAARAAAASVDGPPQPQGSGVLIGAGATLPGQVRVNPSDLPAFAGNIVSQAMQSRADQQADNLVDYCDRWVRDTLGDAAPKVRAQIDKLFRGGAPGGVATAVSSEKNLSRAGLTSKFTSVSDLKPGDTVFYTDGGQNHTGVYLGNNVVRGNNRVTYQDNGGRFGPGGINGGKALDTGKVDPVGNVDINRLGTVNSFVRSGDLLAYLQRVTNQTVTPQAGRQPKEKATDPPITPGAPTPDDPTPLKDTLNARLKQAETTFTLNTKGLEKSSVGYQKAVDRYLATLNNVQHLAFDTAIKLPESDASRSDLAGIVKSTADKISSLSKTGGALEALKKQIEDAKAVFQLYTKETPGYDKALDAYLAVLRKAATESQKLAGSLPAGDKKSALSSLFASTQGEIDTLSKKDGLADRFKRQLEDAKAAFQLVSEDAPGYQKAVETYIAALAKVQAAAQKAIPGTKDREQKNALSDLVASTRSEVNSLRAAGTDADKIAEIVRQKSEQRAQADVTTAKQSVSVAQRAYDDGLKLAGDNATKKLEVVKKEGAALQAAREQQAQRDYQLAKVQADNSLKAALDAAAKGKPALREAAEQLAQAQHTGALNVAGDARQNALLDARDSQARREGQDAVTVSIQRSRTEYSALAATLRDKISTGKVDAQTLQTTLEKMDALDASTKKAGTSNSVYVQGAKANVAALYQQAIDSQIASGAYDGLSDSFDRASKAQGKVVISIADAVAQMPQGTAATAEYLTTLEALEKAGYAAGGSVQAVRDAIYQNGIDADIASGKYDNMTDGFDRARKAQDAIVVSVQDAVNQIPSGDEAVAAYIKTLGELEKQGYASAGSVRAVTDEIKRQKNLEAQDTIDAEISAGTYSAVSDGARQADGQIKPFEKLTYTTAELLAQMPETLKGLDDFEGGLELLASNGSITAKQLDALKAAIQGVRDAAGPIAGLKGDQFEGRGLAINGTPDVKTDAAYGAVSDENKEALQAGIAGATADFLASALKGLVKKGGGKSAFAEMIRAELANRIDVDNLVADIKDNPADYQDGGRGKSKPSEDPRTNEIDFAGLMEGIKKQRLSDAEVLKLLADPASGFTPEQVTEAKALLITSHQDLLDTQRAQTAAHLEIEKQLGLVSEADAISQKAELDKQGIEAAFTRATNGLAETDKAYKQAATTRTQQLTAIDEKADADRQLLSRQRQQSSEDALAKLEEAAADRRHTLGLSSDLEYSQEKETLQLAAIERQHQRALLAAGVDIDLQNAADREAEAQGIAVTTQGEEERRVILLNLRRAAEDAVTALSVAQEEARYKAGTVSEQDHLTASLTARRLAAQRAYGRALADANGNADKVAAAELALQTTLTQIDSDGAEAQISIADKAAAAKVKAAQRKVNQGNGYDFSANRELQGALIDQISQYRSELVGGALDNDKYRATVEALEAAEDALRAACEAQINTFAQYAQQAVPMVTAAMQALGGTSEEVAGQWGSDLSGMVNDVANFAKAISKGDYVGAAIQALTSIFTFFSRQAEAFRAELKKTQDYGKNFRFDPNGYGTRQSEQYTTGILFWKTTHFKETIDEPGKALALSLEGGIVSGVEGGFKAALASGSRDSFTKSVYDGLKEVAFKGLVDGFLNSAPVIAVFGPLVQKLMEAFKSGNKDTIGAVLSDFKVGVASLQPAIDGLLEAGKVIDDALTTPAEKARKELEMARGLATQQISIEQASLDIRKNARLISDEDAAREQLALAKRTNAAALEEALSKEGLTQEQILLLRNEYRLKDVAAETEAENTLRAIRQKNAVDRLNNEQTALELAKRAGLGDDVYQARKRELALQQVAAEQAAALANQALTDEERAILLQQFALRRQGIEQDYLDWQTSANKRAAEIERDIRLQALSNLDSLADAEHSLALAAAETDDQRRQIDAAYNAERLARTLERIALEREAALSAAELTAAQVASINAQFDTQERVARLNAQAAEVQAAHDLARAAADAAKTAADAAEQTRVSWRQSLLSGVQAILSGDSPLDAMYKGVRDRISQAIQDGFIVKRILSQLNPLFTQLDAALSKGLDAGGLIQQIGAALPGLSVQLGSELGPLLGLLNSAIPDLTKAVNGNTAAVKEVQFTQTTIVQSGQRGGLDSGLRARFSRFTA
ncbi:hypothetical protein [Deinococcus alpinitundrae]|uniref:hypothetical protein n=1 Tax=Deinococcus alpinitundrae TaxID=468913 RepID=UPI00137A9973|nr:hypothetical protein [Deinococcus alpinitundrae]